MIKINRIWHKLLITLVLSLAIIVIYSNASMAHFQLLLPSDDLIEEGEDSTIQIQLIFTHPAEACHTMNMDKPLEFGVCHKGEKKDLTNALKKFEFHNSQAWKTEFVAKGFGDFVFYLVPNPYYESMEDAYITQYTKVVVNNAGFPTNWDEEIGLKAEIIPLCKPYGLLTGNVFQGVVKHGGKVVPFAEVEVERLNAGAFSDLISGGQRYPSFAHMTQIIKTDGNGIFTYGIPKSGWWGFAALMEGENLNDKDHEIGAVIWVRVYDIE